MVREDYSQSSVLSTLVGKPTNRYRKLAKNVSTLRSLTDPDKKPNNRLHYSLYPQIQREYQATITQLTNLDFYSPIVRIIGDNPVSHPVGTPYTDAGVEINDYGSTLTSTVSTVDDNVFGIYKVTYTASDGINDDTIVYRTVKVGLRPDATINGDNPYKLEKFDVYTDPGITINDSNSSLITTTSTVNNLEVGTYTVNYAVSNPAFTEVFSRTVRVDDTVPPVITISGDNPYILERFDPYVDPGATADLGSEITNTDLSNVQNTNIGTFDVVYTAYDGNTTVTATRTVNVVDTVPPVITILGDNPYTLERFDPYVDPGATVDRGSILTTDLTAVNNILSHGSSFDVTYTATDGNTAHDVTQTRTVNVLDRKPPQITLLGDNPYQMQPGIDFRTVDPLFEVDLGTSVTIDYSNVVDTHTSTFTVVYTASDGVNPDVSLTRQVAINDTVSPIVTLNGASIITLERYDPYSDEGVTLDPGSVLVSTTSTLDNTVVGSYTITYEATDYINPNTTNVRTINVVDTTPPIVTLNGSSSVILERYGVFADIDEGVDIEPPGTLLSLDISQLDNTTPSRTGTSYTVTYTAVDDHNNTTDITREVVVRDTVPPVVTLNNASTSYTMERNGVWADIDPGVTLDLGSELVAVNVDNTAVGLVTVQYVVSDGTFTTYTPRNIFIVDTTPPTGSIANPTYQLERFGIYTEYSVENLDAGTYLAGTDTSNVDNTLAHGSTFDVVYDLADDSQSNTTLIRTVTVVDTTPPTGSINNPSLTLERFDVYSDPVPGVINLDQGSYIAGIDLSNVDNTLSAGSTFDVIYDLGDGVNNTYLTRTVTIVDTTEPQLTSLIGYNPYYITIGTDYEENDILLDRGSSYTESNNLSQSIGNYAVTYSATDDSGNSNTFSRDLVVIPELYSNVLDTSSSYSSMVYSVMTNKSILESNSIALFQYYTSTSATTCFLRFDKQTNSIYSLNTISETGGNYGGGAMNRDGTVCITGNHHQDRVWIHKFEITPTYPNGNWYTDQMIYKSSHNTFGVSADITLDGDIIIVGSQNQYDIYGGGTGGVFLYQNVNGNFTNEIFIAPPSSSDQYFGYDVLISGNGLRFFTCTYGGKVYIYSRSPSVFNSWSIEATLNIGRTLENHNLAISEDGLTLAILTRLEKQVLIYKYYSSSWSLYYTITLENISTPQPRYINMTYDASYIVISPTGHIYKHYNSAYYKSGETTLNSMNLNSYDGELVYSIPYYGGSMSVIKREIKQLPIEMNGRIKINILKDSVYTDEGVIVRSDYSLDSTVSTVNNTEFGTYTVTYTASENSNIATATRLVSVSPGVQFNNLNYFVERFGSYVEQGITITDGDGYELTIDTSNINDSAINNVHPFDIVYTLTNDTTGHSASYIREITVADTTIPVGELNNPSLTTLDRYGVYTDPGVINLDQGSYYETDLSNVDNTLPHGSTFDVVYNLHDNFNSNSIIRTVTVVDTTPPVGSIANPTYQLERFGIYTEYSVENLDAGTYLVSTDTSNVDNTLAHGSTFDVIYDLGDDVSNTTLIRTVTVVDTTPPVITLVGADPYIIEIGGTYTEFGATTDGGETYTVDTSGINFNSYGDYDAVYTSSDAIGNQSSVTREVRVRGEYDGDGVELVPTNTSSGTGFGTTVYTSNTGSISITGSPSDSTNGTDQGSAEIYFKSSTSNTWSLQQKIYPSSPSNGDYFGYSVTGSGTCDTIAVGAPSPSNTSAAFVSVFTLNQSTSTWSEEAKISYPGGATFALNGMINTFNFGRYISMSNDGNTLAITGGGDIFVYVRNNGTWSHQQTLLAAPGTSAATGNYDYIMNVRVSGDGNTIIGGQPNTDSNNTDYGTNVYYSGGISVFTRSNSTWTLTYYIDGFDSSYRAWYTYFGLTCDISYDGSIIVTRKFKDSLTTTSSGEFFMRIHVRDANNNWPMYQKIYTPGFYVTTWEYVSAYSLSMSHDGNKFIIHGNDVIYIFEKGTTWWSHTDTVPCDASYAASLSSDGRYIMAGKGPSSKAIMVCAPNFT